MKLCECGCRQPAPVAPATDRARGWRKGEPLRFIHGHQGRRPLVVYVHDSGCWSWGSNDLSADGYARLTRDGRSMTAHHFVFELRYGPVPPGFDVHHAECRNRWCVNPSHMEAIAKKDHGHVHAHDAAWPHHADEALEAAELRGRGALVHEIAAALGLSETTTRRRLRLAARLTTVATA